MTGSHYVPEDADRPWLDDPDIDTLSMLEVAAEGWDEAMHRAKNAREVVLSMCVRAVLEGADPAEVMRSSSFRPKPPRRHEGPFGLFMVEHESDLHQFANWLCSHLYKTVTKQSPPEGV